MTNSLIVIDLDETDEQRMKEYIEQVYADGTLLDIYVNDDLYVEDVVIATGVDAPWSELRLPKLENAVKFFERHGIEVK